MDRREALRTGLLAGLAALMPQGLTHAAEPELTKLGPIEGAAAFGGGEFERSLQGQCEDREVVNTRFYELPANRHAIFRRPRNKEVTLVSVMRGIPFLVYEGDFVVVPTFVEPPPPGVIDRELKALLRQSREYHKVPFLHSVIWPFESPEEKGVYEYEVVGMFVGGEEYDFVPAWPNGNKGYQAPMGEVVTINEHPSRIPTLIERAFQLSFRVNPATLEIQ